MVVRRRQLESRACRSGGAAVELALCLPLLILLVFGSIEASNSLFLRQGLAIAAYETAQVASQSGADVAAAELRGQEILDARSIRGYVITITPRISAATPSGTTVVVEVTAPINVNSAGSSWYFRDVTVRSSVTMRRL